MTSPDDFPKPISPEEAKARNSRNMILAVSIVGFMVVIFLVTVVRMSENMPGAATEAPVTETEPTGTLADEDAE